MELTININKKVRATLSKEGAEAINKHHLELIDDVLKTYPNADLNFLKTDYVEGDVIEDSLWYLFSILGNYFEGNTLAPFVKNELTIL